MEKIWFSLEIFNYLYQNGDYTVFKNENTDYYKYNFQVNNVLPL